MWGDPDIRMFANHSDEQQLALQAAIYETLVAADPFRRKSDPRYTNDQSIANAYAADVLNIFLEHLDLVNDKTERFREISPDLSASASMRALRRALGDERVDESQQRLLDVAPKVHAILWLGGAPS